MTNLTRRPTLRHAVALAAVGALAACGGSGDDATVSPTGSASPSNSASSASTPSSPSSSSSAGRTVTITVAGTKVSPAPRTVDLAVGEKLTLVITSDHADELHIHGFEIEKELAPGKAVSVDLVGDQRGVFEVETHESELRLLKIAVQ